MEIKKCREEEDKHKIYTGSATTRAYINPQASIDSWDFQ